MKIENLPKNTPERRMAVENCIFCFLTGSYLYGTSTPNSDKDYEAVFIEDPDYVLGTKRCDEVNFSTKSSRKDERNTKDDVDIKFYSLKKYLELAKLNNPNKIEWFFVPERNVIKSSAYWSDIKSHKEDFLSLKLKHSFCGYAHSQKSKLLTKKERLDSLRKFKNLLEKSLNSGAKIVKDLFVPTTDILPFEYTEFIKKDINMLGQDVIKFIVCSNKLQIDSREYYFGSNIITIYENISREIERYGQRTANLDEFMYDTKFASHIFRLHYEGLSLLKEGIIHYPLPENQYILDVKLGKYTLEEVLAKADALEPLFEEAYIRSELPKTPNHNEISELQKNLYLDFWKYYKKI
jgi:predicted nucleotidyltransferase